MYSLLKRTIPRQFFIKVQINFIVLQLFLSHKTHTLYGILAQPTSPSNYLEIKAVDNIHKMRERRMFSSQNCEICLWLLGNYHWNKKKYILMHLYECRPVLLLFTSSFLLHFDRCFLLSHSNWQFFCDSNQRQR